MITRAIIYFPLYLYLFLCPIGVNAQLANGIYAVFNTNMGSFTAQLHYAEAPLTVANFVGLAEGTQTWLDEDLGWHNHEPFFNNTIVNRIADIPERIIQAGSRNGTNSGGGPGYTFPDEFHNLLRHDKAGILSMANSGLQSNGSQYFLTLGALPGLDDVHAVFGEVISGLDVLIDIGNVDLINNKPEVDVVFHQINILRVGVEANNFDTALQGLPVVEGAETTIAIQNPGLFEINYTAFSHSETIVYESNGLGSWSKLSSLLQINSSTNYQLEIAESFDTHFYSVAHIQYQDSLYTPTDVRGGRFIALDNVLDISLSSTGTTGSISVNTNEFTGSITSSSWNQHPYRGILFIAYDGFTPSAMRPSFAFTNETSGIYKAPVLNFDGSTAFTLSGAFNYIPPP